MMPAGPDLKRHTVSFRHAFDGIWYTLKSQPNLRIHFTVAFLVLLAGWWFRLTRVEWVILLFTILWVVTAEMVNTALESVVNLLTAEYRQEAKIAKDVAAGMVLLGALGSVVVGLVIFLPHLAAR